MRVTVPQDFTDAQILSTNFAAEDSRSAWSGATTYDLGEEVYVASTHSVYKATQGSNLNHDPTDNDDAWWIRISYTNLYKATKLDEANYTEAESTSGIEYEFEADGDYTEMAFLGLRCASVQVVVKDGSAVEQYNTTKLAVETVDGSDWYRPYLIFRDLPVESGFTVEVTIADTGVSGDLARVGKIVLGATYAIGITSADDTSGGFEDLSIKKQDQYGNWQITERGKSDIMRLEIFHAVNRGRWVRNFLISKRLQPCLYWVESHDEGFDVMEDTGLFVFGYANEPETNVGVGQSTTTVDIVGLTFDEPGFKAHVAIAAAPPEAFEASDWSVASGGSMQLDVTISSLPTGTTDIKYTVDGGAKVSTGGTTSFSITGLTAETEYDIVIYAVGPGGDSDPSDVKSATTDAAPSYSFAGYVAGLTGSITSAQTVADETYTDITWSDELFDDGWGWVASDTSFTVPADVGVVVVNAMISTNVFDSDRGRAAIRKNGTLIANESSSKIATMGARAYTVIAVTPGDVINVRVYIETGPADIGHWDDRTFVTIEGY